MAQALDDSENGTALYVLLVVHDFCGCHQHCNMAAIYLESDTANTRCARVVKKKDEQNQS